MKPYMFITVDQPAGRFYVTTINASVLIPISQSQTRTPYNTTGIQRMLLSDRVSSIATYCKGTEAMFPTPIILSGDSKYFRFYKGLSTDYSLTEKNIEDVEYANLDAGYLTIDSDAIIRDHRFLSIVDGQHRLAGISESGLANKFDLLVMFVFDTEAAQDAEIFSIINRNQKQVSKSLVYDLYGLNDNPTVERFAHEVVKAMNSLEYSSMQYCIKMLGYKTDNYNDSGELVPQLVSQGSLMSELMKLITKDSTKDNLLTSEGQMIRFEAGDEKRVFRRYYAYDELVLMQAHCIAFFNAWIKQLDLCSFSRNSIMYKTIGFVAGTKTLQIAFNELVASFTGERSYSGQNMNNEEFDGKALVEQYESIYSKYLGTLNFSDIRVESISSSQSGAKKIVDILFAKSQF
ncbi:DGQHR domain-containing protein [Oribacterium sp. WCC10]|uniref:DGQHR domain-containing protein n=1 Tax=Oribacterium sp. WCC10 TaxID=1855343 RepID=UPI0008E943B0|nr:DGQHR domain-containing protein [Oribacterium sp. WCC10]SFG78033.1 DGQHR domain-containing protein [Oribacterium sp. WCC10]